MHDYEENLLVQTGIIAAPRAVATLLFAPTEIERSLGSESVIFSQTQPDCDGERPGGQLLSYEFEGSAILRTRFGFNKRTGRTYRSGLLAHGSEKATCLWMTSASPRGPGRNHSELALQTRPPITVTTGPYSGLWPRGERVGLPDTFVTRRQVGADSSSVHRGNCFRAGSE